jgi:peroxiredoxin
MTFSPLSLVRLGLLSALMASLPVLHAEPAPTPTKATEVAPVKVGAMAPAATLTKPDGSAFDLAKAYADKPTVLVFYRGGWCPYCVKHLQELGQTEAKLRHLGFQVLAISPDSPATQAATIAKAETPPTYTMLSDSEMKLAHAFGLAFRVDDETYTKYQGYKIDLEKASGQKHHELPVPAVFLVDATGKIVFAHSNPDYRVRLSGADLLAAAEEALGK